MSKPVLVVVDLQRDFYHPDGRYGRHGRPLAPIRRTIKRLKPLVNGWSRVVRVKSVYRFNQFDDMPRLCRPGTFGARWHPGLRQGPLLTKHQHSGFRPIQQYFQEPTPILLSGVCTHRCVRATFRELKANNWPVTVLEDGVASCGRRRRNHLRCLREWRRHGRTIRMDQLTDTDRRFHSRRDMKSQSPMKQEQTVNHSGGLTYE